MLSDTSHITVEEQSLAFTHNLELAITPKKAFNNWCTFLAQSVPGQWNQTTLSVQSIKRRLNCWRKNIFELLKVLFGPKQEGQIFELLPVLLPRMCTGINLYTNLKRLSSLAQVLTE
jgi:hypothetical protein